MRGRHEATVFVDGRRVQTMPCAYPANLQDKESKAVAAAAAISAGTLGGAKGSSCANPFDATTFHIGALPSSGGVLPSSGAPQARRSSATAALGGNSHGFSGRPVVGFTGQIAMIILLKGVPSDAEVAAMFAAGTRCADLDAVCATAAAAHGGGGLMGSRGVTVLAAFAAATAHGGSCAAVCGSAGLHAEIAEGVCILRPLDVRASLGGPLPLLPLVELVDAAVRGGSASHAGMLSPIVHALTALLRGDCIYLIELERCDALGMLAHLMAACPPAAVDADLLASICALEHALESSLGLSDQLLHFIFLRLSLWSKGGYHIMQPLLRQLCRMAGERPEQWGRTDALSRLLDGMLDDFPWRSSPTAAPSTLSARASPYIEVTAADAAPPLDISDPSAASTAASPPTAAAAAPSASDLSARPSYSGNDLRALWDGAFDVLCSLADTPDGVSPSQLRYIVHGALRSGSRGVLASLTRMLVARTYTMDLQLVETLLEGGSSSLAFALLTCIHSDALSSSSSSSSSAGTASGAEDAVAAVSSSAALSEELRSLIVKLLGRLVALAIPKDSSVAGGGGILSDAGSFNSFNAASGGGGAGGTLLGAPSGAAGSAPRLPAAARWATHTTWSKCGWAWLASVLSGASTDGMLLQAATEVLLGTVSEPHRRISSAGPIDVSDSLDGPIALADDSAQPFVTPELLLPLLTLSSNAPPALQRSFVLNLSLWLRHSLGSLNQAMLAQQAGWQLPICSMLNGSVSTGSRGGAGSGTGSSGAGSSGAGSSEGTSGGSGGGGGDGSRRCSADTATQDLCVRLMSEHIALAMSLPSDEAWAEVAQA